MAYLFTPHPSPHKCTTTNRLRQIVEAIVVPNVTMREDEEFLFEDNPTEYIQRDMEVRWSFVAFDLSVLARGGLVSR